MVLSAYTYVFAIGTCFALLEAFNNGANDVANAWATSVSSRSVTYRQAMVLCLVFELLGALTVGARTASTIKNGIIPLSAFQDNAGVQLLAFACAAAGASIWVMWCTRHSAHVSSTYSLISSIAGVGVATVGASGVQWGWNDGKGLGAIFAGLGMAPAISACFAAIIFMLIKLVVHARKNPVPWAVWTSPFFFLIAGTICTLSIVYKGSPNLGLDKKPAWYIAAVTLGVGFGLFVVSALFFVPYVHARVIKKDYTLRWWNAVYGPLLFSRPAPPDAEDAKVPNYAVIQHSDSDDEGSQEGAVLEEDPKEKLGDSPNLRSRTAAPKVAPETSAKEKKLILAEYSQEHYQKLLKDAEERHHAKLRKGRGPLAWAMRTLHANPVGVGSIHETHNLIAVIKRIPAMIVVAALYGAHYDIHTAQIGIEGTPEGIRMERVYSHAKKYPNESEFLYSFVQIITACTASFAHGANDVGNAVGVWAAMYSAWSTGKAIGAKAPVPTWQIAVMALTICIGFITYGYNIMKVMGNKITYHSPSRGSSMEMGAAITVLIFSQYSLPVSTSMCITGATVGVGLCNGTLKAVNWKRVGLLVFSWIMTIPIAGLIGGCLMGILLNTPHF
ncbi:sodium/phosphate symporter [Purpureocillium lavendulum]|uniref:Phosphate transporter n=1 Tax=Purpureocillium lavendulum TaxID=1247861 RepID=A0AB34FH55_9HYPO|nr:sodium/phosphate symporter [Purpureocillium lavendulum]